LRTRPHLWRIDHQLGTGSEYLGVIVAPDHATAVELACKKFNFEPAQLIANELPRGGLLTARRPAG